MKTFLDPETWLLVPPSVAQSFGVLPLARDGSRVRLVLGRKVSEEQRRELESELLFCMGTPVQLETIESWPELGMGGFSELVDRYYATPSVSMDLVPTSEVEQAPQYPAHTGNIQVPGGTPMNGGVSPILADSQLAFRRHLPQLLRESPRQWVAFSGDTRIAIGPSKTMVYREALSRGYKRAEFVVRCIEPEGQREVDTLSEV